MSELDINIGHLSLGKEGADLRAALIGRADGYHFKARRGCDPIECAHQAGFEVALQRYEGFLVRLATVELEAKVGALVEEVENMAQADCLWRREYFAGSGTCPDNRVFPGCLACRARAALAQFRKEADRAGQD
jgi:hypothetical protein